MTQNMRLKVILLCLLILCSLSMIFYLGNLSQLDETGGSMEPLVYRQPWVNNSGQILLTRMIYIERQEHLQKMCNLGVSNRSATLLISDEELQKGTFDHILVDEKHRLLYCYVPKVACTNWKRIFMILTGKANGTDIMAIPASAAHEKNVFTKLSNYSASEAKQLLHTYTKFIFVRHPLERLLSAYRNKLEQHYLSSKYFQARFGRYIVKNYRFNATKEALEKGDDVTFAEFAAYLTSPDNSEYNEHWKPINELCHPCTINYDIVGKYETLYKDSEFILRQAGESRIEFPHPPKPSSTSSILLKYFSTLSEETIMQLYNIYSVDFKLFGYNLNEYNTG